MQQAAILASTEKRDHMELQVVGLRMGILGGSGNLVFNRFTGPGRIGIQSMYLHPPTEE